MLLENRHARHVYVGQGQQGGEGKIIPSPQFGSRKRRARARVRGDFLFVNPRRVASQITVQLLLFITG